MAQVSARYWLADEGSIPRDAAVQLLASLSWRGIGGFPLLGGTALGTGHGHAGVRREPGLA